jgi:hypothetical protein
MEARTVRRRRSVARLAVLMAVLLSAGCVPTTARPIVTPRQRQNFQRDQVGKNLDRLAEAATAANDSDPPIVSRETARQIVLSCKTLMQVVLDAPIGWQKVVINAVEELRLWLGGNERLLFGPYIDLVKLAAEGSKVQD